MYTQTGKRAIIRRFRGLLAKAPQTFAITIGSGATSATATLAQPVDTSRALVFFGGFTSAETSTTYQQFASRAELTNAKTVTAFRNTSTTNAITVYGTVVEFAPWAIASVQSGTVTIATSAASGTATINSVDTNNSAPSFLGYTVNGSTTNSVNVVPNMTLTNATTVTANRNTSSGTISITVGYAVVNFVPGIVKSVQARSVTLATSASSTTDTITAVDVNNTILLYNGATSAGTSYNIFLYNLLLASSTTVTMARGSALTTSRTINYTVLEFNPGFINRIDRGTLAMTNATSADATIDPVSLGNAVCSTTGFSSSLSTNNPATAFSSVKYNSNTDVRALVNTAAVGVTATPGYESIWFR